VNVVGVDVGGTKILAGVVAADGTVSDVVRASTPGLADAPEVVERALVESVAALRADHDVTAVGVGAAGFVGLDGTVRFAPHVSWRDEPLAAKLTQHLGLPVVVDNDANVTALAELRYGAAAGRREVLVLTLGTGIGGAVVMGGAVRRGAQGLAGEFGHLQVVPQGRLCPCGHRGCWEQYASGTALVRAAREAGAPESVTGPEVTAAAGAGTSWAEAAFAEVGRWLGVGLAGLVAGLDPELVVIGGGLSAAGDLLLDPTRDALADRLPGRRYRTVPPVLVAACGPEAGMIGAATLARESHGQVGGSVEGSRA
jgi:glucokinase